MRAGPGAPVPLSVLDLAPVVSGSTAADALGNTIDLARAAERFGYERYWLAEHHLTPGVASSAPAVLMAMVADATERIRVGSGAAQTGHQTPLVIAEQFGVLARLHPGRIDLGLGRSGVARLDQRVDAVAAAVAGPPRPPRPARLVDGLLVPAAPPIAAQVAQLRRQLLLVGDRGEAAADYGADVRAIQAFVRGDFRDDDGVAVACPVAQGADLTLWVLAASPGGSAAVAGQLGLPLAASYHIFPSAALDTIAAYRAAFVPSPTLARPWVMVSADVVVADDDATARELASGYGPWVASIRAGDGAMLYPTPAQAAAHPWTPRERELVADRVDTQFVGSPATVARGLRALVSAAGADELLITTITHDHADRLRSYELLAEIWRRFD
jgi:alkanesulfonate monooxygenase SsuD/methylene tetrahydromethanopterin reductase-like flavin-dependent oxidoreductase (luciferase family)